MKHTPLPFKVFKDAKYSGSEDYPYMILTEHREGPNYPNVICRTLSKANAEFICLAVNNHDKLMEIVEHITIDGAEITPELIKAGTELLKRRK